MLCFDVYATTDSDSGNTVPIENVKNSEDKEEDQGNKPEESAEELTPVSEKGDSQEQAAPEENIKKPNPEDTNVEEKQANTPEENTEELISVSGKGDVSSLGDVQENYDSITELIRLEKEKDERNIKVLEECVATTDKYAKSIDALGIVATESPNGNVYPANKKQFGNERERDLFRALFTQKSFFHVHFEFLHPNEKFF
jgi:hypothetical protein